MIDRMIARKSRRCVARGFALLLMALSLALQPGARAVAPPAFDWPTATPESQELSSERLEAFWSDLVKHQTTALLVIRNDRIVFERYAPGWDAAKPHGTASMAKALVGGMSLTVAMNDGLISPDDLACKFIPEWRKDPLKSKIKIRHLATHTSGIEDAELNDIPHDKLPGWKGAFWARQPDPFTISRDQAPCLFEPGTREAYSNPGMAMLSYAITASLKNAPQKDVRSLLKVRVMDPIGVPAKEWSVGYGATYPVAGLPLVANWGGAATSTHATARVARLMLRRGDWEGVKLLDPEVVEQMLHEGLGWWNNKDLKGGKRLDDAPDDAFWGAGAGHQIVFVVPSLNLIAVRNGNNLDPKMDYTAAKDKLFVKPLMATVVSASGSSSPQVSQSLCPPVSSTHFPSSPVIKEIRWAPKSQILRQAEGCDNWPLTWADDDALYGAYGDGNGFKPFMPKKLSLGFARITGTPPAIQGVNINAPTGEGSGNGKTGGKASGMLMVDGTLYLLARNVGNSKLAWSTDHARTWTWADWKFEKSFGCPAFLNFGKNYAAARDGFVYIFSPDSDSAYTPADRYVMARAPKEKLRERAAWEFFKGLDPATAAPAWTRDVNQRGAVFTNPGKCYRCGITYNPGLRRYLWCMVYGNSTHPQGPRFQGGFGIYDAPEPWGPWTQVFSTDAWDVGPGETNSFPAKWMSADGRRLHLVSSGDDYFSVRAAELILK